MLLLGLELGGLLGYVVCYVLGALSLYLYTHHRASLPRTTGPVPSPPLAPLKPAPQPGVATAGVLPPRPPASQAVAAAAATPGSPPSPPLPPAPAAAAAAPLPPSNVATSTSSSSGSPSASQQETDVVKKAKKAKKAKSGGKTSTSHAADSPLKRGRKASRSLATNDDEATSVDEEERSVAVNVAINHSSGEVAAVTTNAGSDRKSSRSGKKPSSSSSSKRSASSDAASGSGVESSPVLSSSSRSSSRSGARGASNGEPDEDTWSSPSSPPTSPGSSTLSGHDENELRALRADVESLKQSLVAANLVHSAPAVPLNTNARRTVSDSVRIARSPSPNQLYGQMDTYQTTLPVYKKGWLELRTFKMFNRRYFLLHGGWMTYFKDEKMRPGECYGHICLNPSCKVMEVTSKERCFVLKNKSKESLFRMKGPGINAATTHRMMHAATSKVIIRADLQQQASEWVKSIQYVCHLLTSPTYEVQYVIDERSDPLGVSEDGWDEESSSSIASPDSRRKPSRNKCVSTGASPEVGRLERHKDRTYSEPVTTPKGRAKHADAANRATHQQPISTTGTEFPVSQRRHRRGGSEDDEEEDSESASSTGEESESLSDEVDDELSSEDDAQQQPEEEFDYQWPPEQMAAVEALKADLGDVYREENCNMFMLWRFLKARHFDLVLARQMLNEFFVWRRDYRPQDISMSEISDEIALGKAFFIGYDLHRRPIIVCMPGRHDPKTSPVDHFMRYVCFIIEKAIQHMKPPVQQFTCIVDLNGFGMSNIDSNMAKTAAHMLQSYYPERLGVMVAVNCGMVINVAWRMMKSLLDERTRNKINFIKGTKDILKLGIFDPDALPTQYGGNVDRTLPPGSYGLEYLAQD